MFSRIFQPRYRNAEAQAIMDEIESRAYAKADDQIDHVANSSNKLDPSGRNKRASNLTFSN